MAETVLQFNPFQSLVDSLFWEKYSTYKIDSAQLSEEPVNLRGFYAASSHTYASSPLVLNGESMVDSPIVRGYKCSAPGTLINFNTIESFKESDKSSLLHGFSAKIWDAILNGKAEQDPSLLNHFLVLSFVDLKKWTFLYWFAFPALLLPEPAMAAPPTKVSELYGIQEVEDMQSACDEWSKSHGDGLAPSAFLLHQEGQQTSHSSSHFRCHGLDRWTELSGKGGQVLLMFYDPCHLPSNPGWPLRNLLVLAAVRWQASSVRVVSLREIAGRMQLRDCLAFDVSLLPANDLKACPAAVGWERNGRGKNGPRYLDMAPVMDPVRLAQSAADLNLKLMKWRLLPSLNLQKLSQTRCLILGAGTLGCQIGRVLMAWGIRHITFVDSGKVSLSNPVRQSLFTFADCADGGKFKALAAADSLRKILPSTNSVGVVLSIPMPGHAVAPSEAASVRAECGRLEELVSSHDVVFLATDTRESRWLPTLLSAQANKIAINAALGFDTFLVMRHGSSCLPAMEEGGSPPSRLGCYFCNDVVAPMDSTTNRSLDQQCTVTRPGLAPMASALAVELAISLLHHSAGIDAPAELSPDITSQPEAPLGIIPHQIRGFLSSFSQLVVTGHAFDKCTACSPTVLREHREQGSAFLLQVFNQPAFLEDLTGISQMLRDTPHDISWEEWDDEEGVELL